METMISRRCLICANINPCPAHNTRAQEAELRRNDDAIRHIHAALQSKDTQDD